jgi:5-formyltetrahydrofolate cyclo-ligase
MTASLTSGTAVQQAKMALRKQITVRLRGLPPAQVASECSFTFSRLPPTPRLTRVRRRVAQAVVDHLLRSPYYLSAKNISCYLSLPVGEVETDQIIRHALANDKGVFIPYCPIEDKTTMKMLRLKGVEHFEGLKENRWGIRELDPSEVSQLLGYRS